MCDISARCEAACVDSIMDAGDCVRVVIMLWRRVGGNVV